MAGCILVGDRALESEHRAISRDDDSEGDDVGEGSDVAR